MRSTQLFAVLLVSAVAVNDAAAQVAPTGAHQAARASDTGFSGAVNSSGGYSASIPLDLPPAKGGLPVPLEIGYGGRRVGAAGIGWDVPISYIVRDTTYSHRLPILDAATGLPTGEERMTLFMGGQPIPLMHKNASTPTWVPAHDGPQLEIHEERAKNPPHQVLTMYDGEGRTWFFVNDGPAQTLGQDDKDGHRIFDGGDLYVLAGINVPGNSLQFWYWSYLVPLPGGGTARTLNLTDVVYNAGTTQGCFKDRIHLGYSDPEQIGTPPQTRLFSMTMLHQDVLVRIDKLKTVTVIASDQCPASAEKILRQYTFDYDDDPETLNPRLISAQVRGSDGSGEAQHPIVLGRFSYGTTATVPSGGGDPTLQYQLAETVHYQAPVFASLGLTQGFLIDGDGFFGDDGPIGSGVNTIASLLDLTGDGRPDLVFANGGDVDIGVNHPAGPAATSFTPGTALDGNVFSSPDRAVEHELNSGTIGTDDSSGVSGITDDDHGFTQNVYRQAIDFNGDGRIDIVDAGETEFQWVVYLNTPGATPDAIVWQKRRIDVTPLWNELRGRGFNLQNFVPLSRRHSGTEATRTACFRWNANAQQWTEVMDGSTGCALGPPHQVESVTYLEWELKDVNGDSYPDFVFNSATLFDGVQLVPPGASTPNADGQCPTLVGGRNGEISSGFHNHVVRVDLTRANRNDDNSPPIPSAVTVQAVFNVAGPHLNSDGNAVVASYPFSPPVQIRGPHQFTLPSTGNACNPTRSCGVELWAGPRNMGHGDGVLLDTDRDAHAQYCGYIDINGDGLPDRLEGATAYLQSGTSFGTTTMQLPQQPQADEAGAREECPISLSFEIDTTRALRDINGDGIPDLLIHDTFANRSFTTQVQFGTGSGFRTPINVSVDSIFIWTLSEVSGPCSGNAVGGGMETVSGLFDIDGDGQPEMLGESADGNGAFLINVYRVTGADGSATSGRPEAGRLVSIDNGFGATTKITYASAKQDTALPHQVPFPEIVVSKVETLKTNASPRTELVGTSFMAFGNPQLALDSLTNQWTFAGYGRHVEVHATNGTEGVATIGDAHPVTNLTSVSDASTIEARFTQIEQAGRPSAVTLLSGNVGCTSTSNGINCDAWSLLGTLAAFDSRAIAQTTYTYDTKNFVEPFGSGPALPSATCYEMASPYDDITSRAIADQLDFISCRTHGFAFAKTADAWRGSSTPKFPISSTANLRSHSETLSVDDNGNVTAMFATADGEPSLEVDTSYAAPSTTPPSSGAPRVLGAVKTRDVYAYPAVNPRPHYAHEELKYDNLELGSVDTGFVTSHVVERERDDGLASLGLIENDYGYDFQNAMLTSMTTTRDDGAVRTASFRDPDNYHMVMQTSELDAAGPTGSASIPPLVSTITVDPFTLDVTSTTDANQTQLGALYDGFGRVTQTTVTPPPGATGFHLAGITSTMSYAGFGVDQGGVRTITQTTFTDPVADPSASGHTGITTLDELGRSIQTEVQLGASYGGDSLVVGQRTYDRLGRVTVEYDPYALSQGPGYRTTQFFNTDGTPSCFFRSSGTPPQPPFTTLPSTDEASELYPTCFSRTFANHQELVSVREADSLSSGPQAGIIETVARSTTGKRLNHSTWQNGNRLEYADYIYDALGRLDQMRRYSDPATLAKSVGAFWAHDSLGNVLTFNDPVSAQRTRFYDKWGELTDETWLDSTFSPMSPPVFHRLHYQYDALGRLLHKEERVQDDNSGQEHADPEAIYDYQYDQSITMTSPVQWSGGPMLGRLALATSPTGSVAYAYDGLGRSYAQLFIDDTGAVYEQMALMHGDGSTAQIDFFLPDNVANGPDGTPDPNARRDEQVAYAYDSAGRATSVGYSDGVSSQALFQATDIDPFGRVIGAQYGATQYTAAYAPTGRRLMTDWAVSSVVGGHTHSREVAFGTISGAPAFDPVGRERGRAELVDGAPVVNASNVYDALGRLQNQTRVLVGDVQVRSFNYDALGNINSLQNPNQPGGPGNTLLTYDTFGDFDRLTHAQYGAGSNTSLVYDGSGNILQMPTSDGRTRTIDYLSSGLTRRISDDTGNAAHLQYDAFENLSALDVDSPTAGLAKHERHFGPLLSMREEVKDGAVEWVITRTVPGPNGFIATRHGALPATQDIDLGNPQTAPWIFTFGEDRGSRFAADQDGNFVQKIDYEPYGAASSTDANGAPSNDVMLSQYSSAQWNSGDALEALGVNLLGVRVYDPAIGRFLSRDPLLVARTASTTNAYAYAMNDPINLSDPTGMDVCGGNLECISGLPGFTVGSDNGASWFVMNDFPQIPSWVSADPEQLTAYHLGFDRTVNALNATREPWNRKLTSPPKSPNGRFDPDQIRDKKSAGYVILGTGAAGAVLLGGWALGLGGGTALAGGGGAVAADTAGTAGALVTTGTAAPATWAASLSPTAAKAILIGTGVAAVGGATYGAHRAVSGVKSWLSGCADGLCGSLVSCFAAGTPIETDSGDLPIETIRPGDRVRSLDEEQCTEPVDPESCREIAIEMENPYGTPDHLTARFLRSADWVEANHVRSGASLPFKIEELAVDGPATVTSVGACTFQPREHGCLVTGTVTHYNPTVLRLHFEESEETLEPTAQHQLWSLDRGGWVHAGELELGEQLLVRDGAATVAAIEHLGGARQVFNFEVAGAHTYVVSTLHIKSHNAIGCAPGSLSSVLNGHTVGQGFSGAYNARDGVIGIAPSKAVTLAEELPPGWVARNGGHVAMAREVGSETMSQGFTAFLEDDGSLSVEWFSGINNGLLTPPAPGPWKPVPLHDVLHQQILDVLEKTTGRRVWDAGTRRGGPVIIN